MEVNTEESFLFTNRQPGGISTCDVILMEAETYTVRKEAKPAVNGMSPYWFEASVMLPTPLGRCRSLLEKCFPSSSPKEAKVSLGKAICYGGELEWVEGII